MSEEDEAKAKALKVERKRLEKQKQKAKKAAGRRIAMVFMSIFAVVAAVATAYFMSPIKPFKFNIARSSGIPSNAATINVTKINTDELIGVASVAFKVRTEEDAMLMMTDDEEEEGSSEGPKKEKVKPRVGKMMYASLANGQVVEVDLATGDSRTVVHTGETARLASGWECGQYYTESYCGRPMGMSFDQDGLQLYVADAYNGLFKVNVDENTKTLLASEDNEGKKLKFLNGITVSKATGRVYITESSVKFPRRDSHRAILQGGATGRVLMYDPTDGGLTVLSKGLFFPTGVVVVPTADGNSHHFLLITETPRARIRKFKIPSDEILSDSEVKFKGKLTVWKDGLPIYPTNIYWTGQQSNAHLLVTGEERISWLDKFSATPIPRKMIGLMTEYWLYKLIPRKSAVVKLNMKARITKTKRLDGTYTSVYPDGSSIYVSSAHSWDDGVGVGASV